MDRQEGRLARLSHIIHERFLWLLFATYALAACAPAPGLWIRDLSFGHLTWFGSPTRISLSMLLLSSLLLNAGLGVDLGKIGAMLRRPSLLVMGLAANLLIPIAFILIVSKGMTGWHNADEAQNVLVGLALVASMPIAGSSAAWAQNADGDTALSLGLVLFSTFMSPITTPLALRAVGLMTDGDYARDLHQLAAGGTGVFLAVCVLAPSLMGIGIRRSIGDARYATAKPALKLVNSVVLLVLNYSNAAVSLPQAVRDPDLDFLAITLAIVVGLCAVAFAAGWSISRMLKASPGSKASLMFGLGMNNNGTGLVLASMALADHPRVMIPIIFYNLTQHLMAGIVDRAIDRPIGPSGPARPHRSATSIAAPRLTLGTTGGQSG